MPNVTIYHNPRCSKSRQTLALLEKQNLPITIIEYLKTPPDTNTLKTILKQLGITPRALLRTKEVLYKEKGLDNPHLTDNQLIQAMLENPILIERPIVVANNKAVIGRPPENALEIL